MSKTKRPKNDKTANLASEQKYPEEGINQFLEQQAISKRMSLIDKKILILSGKGGVGKSMVAVNLAASLSSMGKRVGLLDIDIHGPSIPMMLHLDQAPPEIKNETIYPIQFAENFKVISIGFLLQRDADAVIWRGPLKMGVIKQFLKDVEWGELDYLIIDSPPGTGDEPLSICQLIQNLTGAVLVTTPQDIAVIDVKKAITFCRKLRVPVLGVIENMSSLTCPRCGNKIDLFKSGGGRKMAAEMGVPFLGEIPVDPKMVEVCDDGIPYVYKYPDTETSKAFRTIFKSLTYEKVTDASKTD